MPFEVDAAAATLAAVRAVPAPVEPDGYLFEGHVDFYGYHARAQGWLFGGWIAHPWPAGNRPQGVAARFAAGVLSEQALVTYYHRPDVEQRGIGFVFLLRQSERQGDLGGFERLEIAFTRTRHAVLPTRNVLVLAEPELLAELQPILAGGEDGSQRRRMLDLLQRGRHAEAAGGFIDSYGYHAAAGGWLFCGWTAQGWEDGATRAVAAFEQGDVAGEAVLARYPRHDLPEGAAGAMLFIPGSGEPLGSLCSLNWEAGGARSTLFPGAAVQRLREPDLVARMRPILQQSPPQLARDSLLALLARQPYAGQDTLAGLSDPVFLEIDEAIVCEPDGLVLIGWCLARPGAVREIRVRSGQRMTVLDLKQAVAIERPDVLAALAAEHGFDDVRCGFLAFLPRAAAPGERIHLEVETHRREVGFRAAPRPRLAGMAAIRRVLAGIDLRFGDIPPAFDRVVGPAVEALNQARLRRRPDVLALDYGRPPERPRFSVVVPLYGRLDFVEYQLALFSAHPGMRDVEFIYVLDEPARRREAQSLFAAVHAAFGVPFRALLLEHNLGFAPANNIGLAHARGAFVAFVNSDVFPGTPDWLERLAARLEAEPQLGAVGPVLLFEDGAVQHQGMHFARLREFGDWFFPQHAGKGLRRPAAGGLAPCLSITGACMLMRRDLARIVGGFDETYAIGDFEDSDLCLKLQALGYGCAVDRDVALYHLERRSQVSSAAGWRMNLTLYNAWQHERRWEAVIAAHQAHDEAAARVG